MNEMTFWEAMTAPLTNREWAVAFAGACLALIVVPYAMEWSGRLPDRKD